VLSAAHTAEHIFAGSLREIQPEVQILKVDQSQGRNSLYVSAEHLEWDIILKAEERVNHAISERRQVKKHFFSSLQAARQRFPNLRAMENRISGEVRVIEIDGYDYAACTREHVENTSECSFFLVTRIVRAGVKSFQIDFSVGAEAKVKALGLAKISLNVADILGAPLTTVEKAIENMTGELQNLNQRLALISEQAMDEVPFSTKGGIKVYSKVFVGLDTKRLMKKAGDLVRPKRSVVLIANVLEDANIIFARSRDITFNAGTILRTALARYDGRGGGRPEFASGSVHRSKIDTVFNNLLESAFSQ
jgi:alanyl-tRNA synthetase